MTKISRYPAKEYFLCFLVVSLNNTNFFLHHSSKSLNRFTFPYAMIAQELARGVKFNKILTLYCGSNIALTLKYSQYLNDTAVGNIEQ